MRKFWLIFSQTATVCLAVLFVVSTLRPDLLTWNLRGDNVGSGVAPVTMPQPELLTPTGASFRDAARQVNTTMQRVEATRKAREFAQRRLDAENKRVTVGLSTTFQLFQAQRDLDAAKQNELRALIDYNRALVNFEAVQVAPLR